MRLSDLELEDPLLFFFRPRVLEVEHLGPSDSRSTCAKRACMLRFCSRLIEDVRPRASMEVLLEASIPPPQLKGTRGC
jgi:hypothetical protein